MPNHSDSGEWGSRIATLNDEVNSLRTVIAEKDTLISKLRKEIHESSEKTSKYSTLVCFQHFNDLNFIEG